MHKRADALSQGRDYVRLRERKLIRGRMRKVTNIYKHTLVKVCDCQKNENSKLQTYALGSTPVSHTPPF